MSPHTRGMPFANHEYFPHCTYENGTELPNPILWTQTDNNRDSLLEEAEQILNRGNGIILDGYFQNYKFYLEYRDRLREWFFSPLEKIVIDTPEDAWIVHIRREDYLDADSALSVKYYDSILSEYYRGESLFLIGKGLQDDGLADYLRDVWGAVTPGTEKDIDDFLFMKKFNTIICSNSTFAWWASFLSHASRIFVPRPRRGYWSDAFVQRLQIPDIHTIVSDF